MARPLFANLALTLALGLLLGADARASVPTAQPGWAELTPQQRQVLRPLASDWGKMDSPRRKKWLSIAERYPSMRPEEQERLQRRMKGWSNLSPEQRALARKKFMEMKKAPPEKREAIRQKLEEYEQLPSDEKQRLQRKTPKKPALRHNALKSRPLPIRPGLSVTKPLTAPVTPIPLRQQP